MNILGLKACGVVALAAAYSAAAAQTITLTGANWYTLNSAKQYTGGFANTYGGDTYSRNLYMTEDQTPGMGSLLNSANLTTLPTRIQIDLSAPGTHTFQMFCNGESTGITPYWGLNLFFNGNDLQPGISVQNTADVAGYQGINPVGTPTLDPRTMGLVQSSGSGPLNVFSVGPTTVTLMSYSTWDAGHYNLDRVDNFTDDGGLGNGTKDNVIEFTLKTTTPVPEPCSLLVLGGSAIAVMARRRARS